MRKQLLSVVTIICILMSCVSISINAQAEVQQDLIASMEGAIISGNGLTLSNVVSCTEKKDGLGGKTETDAYTEIVTHSSNQSFINLNDLSKNGHLDKKYVVLSMSVYGNKAANITPKIRYSTQGQPNVDKYISNTKFSDNLWHSVVLVYNTKEKNAWYLFNGEKSAVLNLNDKTEEPALRIVFETKNATVYIDEVTAYKTDTEPVATTVIAQLNGESADTENGLKIQNHSSITAESNGIGGKKSEDVYTKAVTGSSNGSTFINLDSLKNNNHLDRKYVVLSMNVFGNRKSNVISKIRYGGNMADPNVTDISKDKFMEDRWNNVMLVYNTVEKTAYTLLNGDRIGDTFSCSAHIDALVEKGKINAEDKETYLETEPALRVVFYNANAEVYYDDVIAYKTDTEPVVKHNILSGEVGKANNSIIVSESFPIDFTSQGVSRKTTNGTVWENATAVLENDILAVETVNKDLYGIEYGKTYKYVKCVSSTYSSDIITQSNMGFTQGGKPYNNDGEEIEDTRCAAENVLGSGKTLEFVGIGVNNNTSIQTFYKAQWKNANNHPSRYLVLEADFAFAEVGDNLLPATGFSLTTNGGTAIGSSMSYDEYKDKVNHYVWIYDTHNGTYTELADGNYISENVAVNDDFKNGTKTDIRTTFNGKYDASGNGTSVKMHGAYIGNIKITECNTSPVLGGIVTNTIKWSYDSSTKTLSFEGTGAVPDYAIDNFANNNWNEVSAYAQKVVIGEGITGIGEYALYNCKSLKQAKFSSTLTDIGTHVFDDEMLTEIVFVCNADGYTHNWAEKNGYEYRLEDEEIYITSYSIKNAEAVILNSEDTSIYAYVIFGNYENGELADVYVTPDTVCLNVGKNKVSANDFVQNNGSVTKVMVWNTLTELDPLCKDLTVNVKPVIRIAGDSISAEWSTTRYGQQGWGKCIQDLWNDDIVVINDAVSGWTTEKYYTEKWEGIKSELRSGDYLLVSYLHNDYYVPINDPSKSDYINTYKDYLEKLIKETKEMGVNIVLVVPPNRGVQENFHGDFAFVMPELAEQYDLPLIDIHAKTIEMLNEDLEETKKLLYMYKLVEQGIITQEQAEIHSNQTYRTEGQDLTHLSTRGAAWVAEYVADNLVTLIPELKQYKK